MTPGTRLRAAWAALLSLAVPGLGQVHARAWHAGLILLAINEALSIGVRILTTAAPPILPVLAAVGAILLASLALMIAAAVDAWRRTRAAPLPPPPRWFRSAWFTAVVLIALGVAVDAALPFGWRSFFIPSASMVPSLMVGDYLIADTRPAGPPARGAIIIFHPPNAPDTDWVKRVIALPGDRVAMQDGQVILNGTPVPQQPDGTMIIPEPLSFGIRANRAIETLPGGPAYPVLALNTRSAHDMAERTIPPGQLFVLGDNRDNSVDSRFDSPGLIPIANVVGTAATFYWSQDRARILTRVK